MPKDILHYRYQPQYSLIGHRHHTNNGKMWPECTKYVVCYVAWNLDLLYRIFTFTNSMQATIKLSQPYIRYSLHRKDYSQICSEMLAISPYVRFVGIIGKGGKLLAHSRRQGMKPLLNAKNTRYQFSHIAIKTDMEAFFDRNLGHVEFIWEEREKVQTISFGVKKTRVWMSIDKNVVRSEMLRIIDACLPIVRKYQKSQ